MIAPPSRVHVDEAELISDFGETIQRLRGEQSTLQSRLSDLNHDIRAAKSFLSDQTDFSREATEQRARLKSIELFKAEIPSPHQCPFCESELRTPIPTVDQVNESLREVSDQLEGVYRDSPHIQRHIAELETTIGKASDDLRLVQREFTVFPAFTCRGRPRPAFRLPLPDGASVERHPFAWA
jgi:DNA repair exonuclease SbcCD ATPase subunit